MIHVDCARKIDYWFGAPLCFLLTIVARLEEFFFLRHPPAPRPVRKILFIELSEMGSAILAYSSMSKARELYPDAQLFFLVFESNVQSARITGVVPCENILTIRNKNIFLFISDALLRLWQLASLRIDVAVDFELFSRVTAILAFLSGARVRVGFSNFSAEGLYRGNLHTVKVAYNPRVHIAVNFLSLVYALTRPEEEVPGPKIPYADFAQPQLPRIKTDESRIQALWSKLRKHNSALSFGDTLIVVNPGSSVLLPLRKWPIERYAELVRKLQQASPVYIVVTGLKDDFDYVQRGLIDKVRRERCINLAGETTLEELVDLFSVARLFISHDSGAIHFAALTAIPMVVLFGPETPVLYAPLSDNCTILSKGLACSPCVSAFNHRRSLCKDNKCMQEISVEEVFMQAKKYLIYISPTS